MRPQASRTAPAAALALLLAAAGCGDAGPAPAPSPPATPAERGKALFGKRVGGLACADCHSTAAEDQPDPARRRVGHSLRDATRRPYWWHGTLKAGVAKVDDAVLTCVARFQQRSWNRVLPVKADGTKDLSAVEVEPADAAALVAFLETLSRPGPHEPLAAGRDASSDALARVDGLAGDRVRGLEVYRRTCLLCHGPGGKGDLGAGLRGKTQAPDRFRVIEYCRSGPTRQDRENSDAWMPFLTPDVLPDQDLSDVATLLEADDW